ncbi:Cysteine/serine-rich nuclear protein 2 [Sarcoptes scabiei]|uniref:Cysteine/serine-rich nuclear protein 2 n=1 Tax=Sarcoptes scabiei TaxID=52283 RepID=A0A834R3H0_SARSC|nr:Cysteine/serine-rich nuclear protein 2 [Sarcoptes scabiei]
MTSLIFSIFSQKMKRSIEFEKSSNLTDHDYHRIDVDDQTPNNAENGLKSTDISKSTTKLIKIDQNLVGHVGYTDKCIQVGEGTDDVHKGDLISFIIKDRESDTFALNSDALQLDSENVANEIPDSSHSDNNVFEIAKNDSPETDVDYNESKFKVLDETNSTKSYEILNESEFHKCISTDGEFNDDNSSSSSSGVISISNSSEDNATTSSTASSDSERPGPLRSLLKMGDKESKPKKKVIFNKVTVFYFKRSQGFTCVPSQGGSTLGMENTHSHLKNFTLESHAEERKRAHREILLRQKRLESDFNKQSSTSESEDDSYDDFSDLSDIDLESDSCYFLQPVPIKQRRALLRASGVRKIETAEKEECRDIRISREFCGCDCRVYCSPEVCSCYQAGIKCQVDRMSFPCGCSREGCANTNGRIEFNPIRVRSHFIHTIMRLEMEKNKQENIATDANPIVNNQTDFPSNILPDNYIHSNINQNCNQMLHHPPSSNLYTPLQPINELHHTQINHFESAAHVAINDNDLHQQDHNHFHNDSFVQQSNQMDMFANEYSTEDSSYSENSDYTSDDFEDDAFCSDKQMPIANVQQSLLSHSPHHHDQSSLYDSLPNFARSPVQNIASTVSSIGGSLQSISDSNAKNILLPSFLTISCEMSSNDFKPNLCQSYTNSEHQSFINAYDSSFVNNGNNVQENQSALHTQCELASYSYDYHNQNVFSEMTNLDYGFSHASSHMTMMTSVTLIQ